MGKRICLQRRKRVALLAEGVDRNLLYALLDIWVLHVALLAEGVDRNLETQSEENCKGLSPSSRRAWIEIARSLPAPPAGGSRPPRGGRG